MSLRARLTLFFTGIVVLPLVAATAGLQVLIDRDVQRRTGERLELASAAADALWRERLQAVGREVRHVARDVAREIGSPVLAELLRAARDEGHLDFLVVVADGAIVASSVGTPAYLAGVATPSPQELAADGGSAALLRTRVEVLSGNRTATVVGGLFVDLRFLGGVRRVTGLEVLVADGGRVVASTVVPPPGVPESAGPVEVGGGRTALVTAVRGGGSVTLLAAPDAAGGFRASVWLIVLGGLLVATVLAFAFAGLIARPLQRLADGAAAVAAGDLETRVETEGQGDVARLAESFNAMTEHLRGYVGELRRSRDELRGGLDRLGATLRATHDLEGMFAVILDTAAITLGAKAGAVYLLSPAGREVRLEVARGYDPPTRSSLRLGEGIAGRAAAGIHVLVPSGPDAAQPATPVEPAAPTAVAVPLVRGERTMGVLALYGRGIPEPFAEEDLATLGSFAAQASVAVENVLLHQEAQRLSITDGLTGVWNRRYLQLTLTKEIERAQRFGRPLSVLLLDIDHFKQVNDDHGHQVGDEVLVELTRRTMGTVRTQIDTLARYGGEEFVVVLPETPREGALVAADKILSVVRHRPFAEDGDEGVPITVSIGLSSYPEDGVTADDLVRAADLAMYRAKQAGRDRIASAESS